VHTFTCSTVVAGLRAAANFAALFAEFDRAIKYRNVADEMVASMRVHLYNAEIGRFLRSLRSTGDGRLEPDSTIDASLFGIFYFGCFSPDDEMVVNTMKAVSEHLNVDGGVARFDHDGYMRVSESITGNPWFICTLLAEQLDPITREHVSVSPLTWSHSTFVATVSKYLEKLRSFG
jgi:GH15 family glucan-1,4-alpha-glucosidase